MAKEDMTDVVEVHEVDEEEQRRARREAIYNRGRFRGLQIDPEVDFYPEVADREPGDTNFERWGFDLHPQVSAWSAGILVILVAYVLIFAEQAGSQLDALKAAVNNNWSWFYIISVNIVLVVVLYFAFSRFGKIRIGGPEAKPEFTNFAWYSMLVSAGMGIGLVFFSVAEPIFHFTAPPPLFGVEPGTGPAGTAAMAVTYYHWGLHPWAIYAFVGLALAFFAYNRGLPLTFRSVFYPLLKERIYGPWGNAIDVLTILATLSGLAASLGFGVSQASAGLNFLFGTPDTTLFQVGLIVFITGLAIMSVVAGLDGGVKRLSQLNIGLAGAFLVFVLVVGPTLFLLSLFSESTGFYLGSLLRMSFWNEAFTGGEWQGAWTIVYWGWWISWSPFVGMFIARVSKGRTARELVLGATVVPSLVCFLWMAVFGGTAIDLQMTGARDVATAVNENVATATFDMFQGLPLATVSQLLLVVLVMSFFVTSSDSGSLVVDHLTSGGKLDSPVVQRVFWASMEGVLAAVLLLGGGLGALQTAAISTGLPFAAILLLTLWSLHTAFSEEMDLLGGHYEAAQFRERHKGLLERAGLRGPGKPKPAQQEGGAS